MDGSDVIQETEPEGAGLWRCQADRLEVEIQGPAGTSVSEFNLGAMSLEPGILAAVIIQIENQQPEREQVSAYLQRN